MVKKNFSTFEKIFSGQYSLKKAQVKRDFMAIITLEGLQGNTLYEFITHIIRRIVP